ncbi:hypothetical protein [[Flexibacter] sp. ATCC 35208]|uniref:hypothetical protein n=1 Tax=[Flexibacter] sp. ATCC 35208 TaxID=1936242 RepID=UPI0009C90DC4|nr:hypothetical protein BW716_34155 [[Flexibacter] sp. ATCC 35208]
MVLSLGLKVAEFRGCEFVNEIFKVLSDPEKKGHELLPDGCRNSYDIAGADQRRIICDFIVGMTDRYAIEFYGRLKSENEERTFKSILNKAGQINDLPCFV